MSAYQQVQALYEAWEERTLRKGVKRGRAEALRQVLTELLTQRFGSVPDDVSERIRRADTPTLERWVTRVLPAASLDDVLG